MASVIYPKAKEQFLQGGINLSSANVKVVIVDEADYTYNAAHEFLSDIPSGARVGTSGNLASKTFTNGVFDAANPTITAATGDPIEAVVFYVDTGNAATSRLLSYHDGLNLTPNGGDVVISINGSGIFSL